MKHQPSRKCRAKDLQNPPTELLCETARAHDAGNLDDFVKGNGLGVLDVLLLLAVTRRLLQGLDDERGGRRNNGDSGLTVLDRELDGDTETLPVAGSFGNIFTCIWCQYSRRNSKNTRICFLPIFLGERPRGPTLGANAD